MAHTRRFEYSEGTSNKFWEVWTDGAELVTRFGKIGTTGQESRRRERTPEAAATLLDKLVREKTGKGYVEKRGAKATATAKRTPAKAATAKTTPAKAAKTEPLVEVGELSSFGASASVGVLFVDASHLGSWTGTKTADGGGAEASVGKGRGVVVAASTGQVCDVFRLGSTVLVTDAAVDDDDGDKAAEAYRRAVVDSKTKKPSRIGSVKVESGVLALHAPSHRPARAPTKAALRDAAEKGHAALPEAGLVLVALPKGMYELWMEDIGKDTSWGTFESRLRLVPAGTAVVVGEPVGIAAAPARGKPKAVAAKVKTALARERQALPTHPECVKPPR